MRRLRPWLAVAGLLGGVLAADLALTGGRALTHPLLQRLRGRRTVTDVQEALGPAARARLAPHLAAAQVSYPPAGLTLVALKDELRLELWARNDGPWRHVRAYPILGASGLPGPKLRRGDRQVPEGLRTPDAEASVEPDPDIVGRRPGPGGGGPEEAPRRGTDDIWD